MDSSREKEVSIGGAASEESDSSPVESTDPTGQHMTDKESDRASQESATDICSNTGDLEQERTNGTRHSRPTTLRSYRSYGDGHGHVIGRDEEDQIPEEHDIAFKVEWDGDKDPANPKSMSLFRKWVIVLNVSFASLCV
jgi:hypothetical protein